MIALRKNTDLGGKAPDKIRIFPSGEVRIDGAQSALMDKLASENIISAVMASDADMVIDYEHQTLYGGEAPAAGWLKRDGFSFDENEGFFGTCVWTKRAKKYIESGEYRYFSPVFNTDRTTNRIMRLHNVALTNQPRMQSIVPLAAKQDLSDEIRILKDAVAELQNKESDKMSEEMKKLREHLKVGDDVTDAEIVAKIIADLDTESPDIGVIVTKALEGLENPDTAKILEGIEIISAKMGMQAIRKKIKADEKMPDALVEQQVIKMLEELEELRKKKSTTAKAVLDALELTDKSSEAEVIAKIHVLNQRPDLTDDIKILKEKLGVLEAEKKDREVRDLVQLGLSQRKITPAIANDPESFACTLARDNPDAYMKYLEQAPKIVSNEKIETPTPKKSERDDAEFAAKLDIDLNNEDFQKYGEDD